MDATHIARNKMVDTNPIPPVVFGFGPMAAGSDAKQSLVAYLAKIAGDSIERHCQRDLERKATNQDLDPSK